MLQKLFRPRTQIRFGDALYARAVDQARRPEFYTRLGVADRIDARFELYTLHVLLLVMRLRDEGAAGAEAGQELFDTYVSALDHALRELGVGDIVVGKKMRKLAEAMYGRMTAYEPLIRANDRDGLSASLARNVFETDDASAGGALADYALASRSDLARQAYRDVTTAPVWPEIGR